MYVGPWQEYRLGQLFNDQTRAMADAVRAQIQAQIQAEQAATPQLQLPHRHAGSSAQQPSRGSSKGSSYSSQLRQQSFLHDRSHAASTASTAASSASGSRGGGRSGASTANSSYYAPSQRGTQPSSAASMQHSTASALRAQSGGGSGLFEHPSMLPPLQAAARAAVDKMQASRVRATANHPLAHIVGSYLPEAVTPSSSAVGGDLSRQSSHASSAAAAEAAQASRSYLGGNPSHLYRPPAHAIPKLKRQPAARTEKQVAQAHREHLGKLRALYGMGAASGAAAESAVASEAGTPVHAASPSSATGGDRLPSLPQLPQHASSSSPQQQPARSVSKPYVLPASVMPQLSATSLALYGPIPDELAASLSFYAKPPPKHAADAAALAAANRVAHRLPHEHVEDEVSPSHHQQQPQRRVDVPVGSTSDSWLSSYSSQQQGARPSSRSHPATQSVGPWNAPASAAASAAASGRPNSRGQLLTPLHGSSLHVQHAHSNSASKLQHLPGAKMSAEQQWMVQQAASRGDHSDASRLHTPLHPAVGGVSRSRLHTPQHSHSRANLHSSGGVSDAGFEHEVDDLLGWAAGVATHDEHDEASALFHAAPGTAAQARQIMHVHA